MAEQRSLGRSLVADQAHGPLPLLLLGLTVLTGVVDAVSILALGRVFVANMTGNVVFVGFAVAGAAGFSLAASLLGLAGFVAGAGAGGRLIGWFGSDRGRLLAIATSTEVALFALATVLVGLSTDPVPAASRNVAVTVLAMATGMQNAVVRQLAVPDLTTTVLTMTLTGLASDIRAGGRGAAFTRRLLAVATMLGGGALVGAELVLRDNPTVALAVGGALLALVAAGAWFSTLAPGAWRAAAASAAGPSSRQGGTQ